ncbi:hypothetical protein BCR36DRAFT_416634 [Piromyces finnis]|uniref:Uncharacterized protein n=1 Tax=Piromyces finnis TaxID=1754191 RepID=A0A1Y1UUK7_9FUNG|nr:hypothetical protein BCR36DRAFT_416634 [Piromyces finnis]|eukprot:ORX41638.1 hypothetical protein BCR36DRAFT_416634 [Piromyces finnis]
METLNKISNKRKFKFKLNDRQNYNKKLKTNIQKDSDLIKYIIRCTENNTKLLEDLKYNFKSNEISNFTKRLKKYIAKREKIERRFNNKISNNENEGNEEQIEFSSTDNSNTLDKSSNPDSTSINFVFTDRKKNIKEILIIKPINEVKEIKYNYCQLDTTNRYIIKRIKKDNFVEAYNNDLDFKNFLALNHQLFEGNISNEESDNRNILNDKEILNANENKGLLERNNTNYHNGHKEINDMGDRSNVQDKCENKENNRHNLQEQEQEPTVIYTNENHKNSTINQSENENVINEEEDIPFPFFAKNSFGLLDENEFDNNHNNSFQHYFSNNINEKYKIVYGKEMPHNLNEFDDGDKENNNPHELMSERRRSKNDRNMKIQNSKQKNYIHHNTSNNNNTDNNNNILDSEIETFRAINPINKNDIDNFNESNINILKNVFNKENRKKKSFLSSGNNKGIYNDNSLTEISSEINNPVIDKIIKLNKTNKNSNKALSSSINKELYLDESSSFSIPPSIETFEASLESQLSHSKELPPELNRCSTLIDNKNSSNNNNSNSNCQNHPYDYDDEVKENKNNALVKSNENKNSIDTTNLCNHQEQEHHLIIESKSSVNPIQNNTNDIVRQTYLKRTSDLKAYWPTFTYTIEDPSSKDFTTTIQKNSPFSPYLQYLILLNKELNKKNEREKDEQVLKNNTIGGYIVINKDIKGSWTNTEIMKYIKKQRVVNNELNLLIPLKCVVYDCSQYNKYVKKERAMYYLRLYQKLNMEKHTTYIDVILENINSEDVYDYALLFSVPVEAFDMYICKNEEEINYHKAEVHIEHSNNEYDHFKVSCILGSNTILEFIQKLRVCRGLDYDKTLPTLSQLNIYDKTKENERRLRLSNTQYELFKLRVKNGKEE